VPLPVGALGSATCHAPITSHPAAGGGGAESHASGSSERSSQPGSRRSSAKRSGTISPSRPPSPMVIGTGWLSGLTPRRRWDGRAVVTVPLPSARARLLPGWEERSPEPLV